MSLIYQDQLVNDRSPFTVQDESKRNAQADNKQELSTTSSTLEKRYSQVMLVGASPAPSKKQKPMGILTVLAKSLGKAGLQTTTVSRSKRPSRRNTNKNQHHQQMTSTTGGKTLLLMITRQPHYSP